MVYEFNGSPCEGYTVQFRFVTKVDTSENSRVTDQQTTTFEEGNGRILLLRDEILHRPDARARVEGQGDG